MVKENASVVFFGSSKTMNGINDSLLNAGGLPALNLGYCRFGRNLDHFFIKEYLATHKPQKIVVEVRPYENDNSHPISPFLLPVEMVIDGFITLNEDVFSDLYDKWLCNLKYLRLMVFNFADPEVKTINNVGYWRANQTHDKDALLKELLREKKKARIVKATLNRNSEFYLQKIANLCREKNIQLFFLYLPSFGNVDQKPACAESYKSIGRLILPPESILSNPDLFANYDHFNDDGAAKLTLWCKEVLNNKP